MRPGALVREMPGGRYGRVLESTIEGLRVATWDNQGKKTIETWEPARVQEVQHPPVVAREMA